MTSPASSFTLAARSDAAAPAIGKREGDAEAALGAVVAQFDRATADDAAISDDAAPDRRFAGVARLHGAVAYRRLQQSHAMVVGIGGVGSWAAEALARSAVGRITLIDLDHIAESNTNRQIHALGDSYGQAKAQAMAARIAQINPACRVETVEDFITPDNVEALLERCSAVDVVIDCIDQVVAKAALAAACRRRQIALITCGAAGGRLDPTRLRCDDLARTQGDPLLAKVRARLRRDHGFARGDDAGRAPRFHVTAVFSDEPVRAPLAQDACDVAGPITQSLACSGYGSSVTVTAPMGFAAAAQALSLLIAADRPRDAVTADDVDVAATPAQQRATVGG